MTQWTEERMQAALTSFGCLFYFRRYTVVPNVSWGLPGICGEVDLLCLSAARVLHEVEIKVSRADLLADKRKAHGHAHKCVAYSWFAVPEELAADALELVPDRFGIVTVRWREANQHHEKGRYFTRVERRPKRQKGDKIDDKTERQLLRLGVMKMWSRKGAA